MNLEGKERMNVLIFNCGSSSQGFKVYQTAGEELPHVLVSGKARNVATKTMADAQIDWQVRGVPGTRKTDLPSHRVAAQQILAILKENGMSVDAIGHRFVHGGTLFEETVQIDEGTLQKLKQCLPLAPIHNPNSYSVIEVCREELPDVPQYAVFDTAFHAGMPDASRQYAIPYDLAEQHGFRKVGFHGLSYQYVSAKIADLMGRPLEALKLILCHLGTGGSSVVAVKDGKSLDHSMGYSPMAGLVMSTRCGDIDPEIVLEMVRLGYSAEEVGEILNNRSGLIGISGVSSNLQEIIAEAEKGNPRCWLAYEVYAQRLKLYLGAYTWLLGGADAIVFTDDVGMKSWQLREKVCGGVENLGVAIDREKNQNAPADRATLISSAASKTQIWAVPTDEEIVILREVLRSR
jgi:acetate kinase